MIIGMDFGTTNSGIAAYDGSRLQIIPFDKRGSAITRTAMYITNDRQVTIGRAAIDTYFEQNLNRPVDIRRVRVGEISQTFAELPTFIRDVYIDKDLLEPGRLFISFKTGLSSPAYVGTVVGSHFYFLEDVIAIYLYIAKQRAESVLGTQIDEIVLGRPVRFSFNADDDALARERLLKAAFRAGYKSVYLQYEPIAAAYDYERGIDDEQNVLVFDFGGGTLDLSVLRMGDPKRRKVLATDGVPIAGDIFDQKLTRARLPKHFGEGTQYRSANGLLPVPSSFYEAFSNWQEMLLLQRPRIFGEIERIERAAVRPTAIRALKNLVASSYALKMFDIVEGTKRHLSHETRATIHLSGDGFDVSEPVMRAEFEAIIGPEIRLIENHIDSVIAEAGLTPDKIDVVLRTGGSSEIPAFIDMLTRKFGANKLRIGETFSSVTAGLGIIAHEIAEGKTMLKAYHASEDKSVTLTPQNSQFPPIDFDVMKKFIALVEDDASTHGMVGVTALTTDGHVIAALHPDDALEPLTFDAPIKTITTTPADARLIVMTSEFRLLVKTARSLAGLRDLGLTLEDSEGFFEDEFGAEYVSGIATYAELNMGDQALFVSTSGYYKALKAAGLVERLSQPIPYSLTRLKSGDPAALIGMHDRGEVIIFTRGGRAARVAVESISDEGRLLRVPTDDQTLAVFPAFPNTQFILAAPDGTLTPLHADDLPLSDANSAGTKAFNKRELAAVIPYRPDAPIWAVTSTGARRLQSGGIPSGKLSLAKGEILIGLITRGDS